MKKKKESHLFRMIFFPLVQISNCDKFYMTEKSDIQDFE